MFSIASLQIINDRISDPQILILSPTRELAEQTQRVVRSLGDFMKVKCHACTRGKNMEEDLKLLNRDGVQIISGTPGRVLILFGGVLSERISLRR